MAIGLDCGTSFYISARKELVKKQRNAFLTLDGEPGVVKRMLSRKNIPYVERNNKVHIVGQYAFDYAQIFSGSDLKRPMKDGLLNPRERDALPVLKAIISELLGTPEQENELCVYCVPSKPIDRESFVNYHEDALSNIIESLGYKSRSIEESVALAYEGLADYDLTGVAISMGAGMCNLCVMYAGMPALTFAVTRGGDFIDEHVGLDTGISKAKAQYIKESSNIDLHKSDDGMYEDNLGESNVQSAIRSYYGVLIKYLLANLKKQFEAADSIPNFPEPVPLVIGGGTVLVKGFVDFFKSQLESVDLPIPISEVILVESSHTAVARGCLADAVIEE